MPIWRRRNAIFINTCFKMSVLNYVATVIFVEKPFAKQRFDYLRNPNVGGPVRRFWKEALCKIKVLKVPQISIYASKTSFSKGSPLQNKVLDDRRSEGCEFLLFFVIKNLRFRVKHAMRELSLPLTSSPMGVMNFPHPSTLS